MPAKITDYITAFRERYDVDESGCWLWNRSLNSDGYGQWTVRGRPIRAHRWAYETFVGRIPDDLVVGHKCDVKRCVNPDHLEAITVAQNTQDAYDRGLSEAWQVAQSECPYGHPYPPREPGKYRRCLECQEKNRAKDSYRAGNAERNRRYRARKKQREVGTNV
jgi:hypothetical protein